MDVTHKVPYLVTQFVSLSSQAIGDQGVSRWNKVDLIHEKAQCTAAQRKLSIPSTASYSHIGLKRKGRPCSRPGPGAAGGPSLFPQDQVTDQPGGGSTAVNVLLAKQVPPNTKKEEIPYSTTVIVEAPTRKTPTADRGGTIYCDAAPVEGILVGKAARRLKKIYWCRAQIERTPLG